MRDLHPGQAVRGVFLLRAQTERAGHRGDAYLVLALTDRTGHVCAFAPRPAEPLFPGDLVRVVGRTRLAQGALAIVAKAVEPLDPAPWDLAEFTPQAPEPAQAYLGRVRALAEGLRAQPYRRLVGACLEDPAWVEAFCRAPASLADHHAYQGGLLQHTAEVMETVLHLATGLPAKRLDLNLLLTAAFFHDIGKMDAYTGPYPYRLTPLGRWVGHETLGVHRLLRALDTAAEVPIAASGRLLALLSRPLRPRRHIVDELRHEAVVLDAADGLSAGLARDGTAAWSPPPGSRDS